MIMKCVECNRTKGKRACRLKAEDLICPRCCAVIRSLECRGCHHFESAMVYEAQNRTAGQIFPHVECDPATERAIDQALDMIENNRLVEAKALIRVLRTQHPDNYLVLYAMGTVLSIQGHTEEGIRFLKQSIESFPYFAEAHFNLGVAYKQQRDIPKTIMTMRRVIELANPDLVIHDQAKHVVVGIAKIIQQKDQMDLDTYLVTHAKFDEAADSMAAKQWSQAIAQFETVLKAVSSHVQSLGNLGICYASIGETTLALEYLDQALVADPGYELARSNRIRIEQLAPGEKLEGDILMVDYYKDSLELHRDE